MIELTKAERESIVEAIRQASANHCKAIAEETKLMDITEAAEYLKLSIPQTRRVLNETIDFGPKNTRVSLADLQRAIESRRVCRK